MQQSRNGRPRRDLSRQVSGHPDPLRELIKIQHRRHRRQARERCDRMALDTKNMEYQPSPHRISTEVEDDHMEEICRLMRECELTIREVKRIGFAILRECDKDTVLRDIVRFYALKETTHYWWQEDDAAEAIYEKMKYFLTSLSREVFFALRQQAQE
jgi:hypothetical protein